MIFFVSPYKKKPNISFVRSNNSRLSTRFQQYKKKNYRVKKENESPAAYPLPVIRLNASLST